MSYDEHLISMAGGDGGPLTEIVIENCATIQPVDLEVIAARQRNCRNYNFGLRDANSLAHNDIPYLLALVREQQAQIERVEALCDAADKYGDYHVIQSDAIRAAITATEEA